MQTQDQQTLNFIRNRMPSRERIEVLRACVLLADDSDTLLPIIEDLLDVRQAVQGGRRDIRGSRHWPSS